MGRPVNEEMKKAIEKAAYNLFETVGYDKATYAAIADAVGISRNLVQYHYPKKEMLAISYMNQLVASAQDGLRITDKEIADNPMLMGKIGASFFEMLLATEGKRAFLQDIIRSRDLTEDVLAFNTQWALSHAGQLKGSTMIDKDAERSVIVHMGGFYELLYHSLKTGEPIENLEAEINGVVEAFINAIGLDAK